MSRSVNKVVLIGNMGSIPEVRTTQSGAKVATFPLATSRRWKTNGEDREKTEWHKVVSWNSERGKLADVVERFGEKGLKCYVEGRLEYRSYQAADGSTKYVTEIIASEFVNLNPRTE